MSSFLKVGPSLFSGGLNLLKNVVNVRPFQTTIPSKSKDDRRIIQVANTRRDQGTDGEGTFNIDASIFEQKDVFPTEKMPNMLFNGIPFSKVPICNVRVSKNNTILTITDAVSGEVRLIRSCGIEGFKNTRKGTNVAAQATAQTFAAAAINKGYTNIRVRVRGLGPGRMSAIKGLQMAGMNIISVTDSTPVSWNPPRPRKARRL